MKDRYDVIVIGGGVSGCSTAFFLAADQGFDGRVLVVEREPTYQDAPSARATGGIRQQFSTPENIRIGLFGAHFAKNVGDYLGPSRAKRRISPGGKAATCCSPPPKPCRSCETTTRCSGRKAPTSRC